MTPAVNLLKKQRIDFELHAYSHDPNNPHFGLEAVEKLSLNADRVFKTLIVAENGDQKKLAVMVVPVSAMLNIKSAAAVLGVKRVEIGEKEAVQKSSGYLIGGISPLGQKKPLPTVIDQSAQYFETIFISGGKRGLEIELAPQDLATLTNAIFAAISA